MFNCHVHQLQFGLISWSRPKTEWKPGTLALCPNQGTSPMDPPMASIQSNSLFLNTTCPGQYFWSEITNVKQSRWTATFMWLENTTGIRINILHSKFITTGLKTRTVNRPLRNWTCDLVFYILWRSLKTLETESTNSAQQIFWVTSIRTKVNLLASSRSLWSCVKSLIGRRYQFW